MFGAPGYVNVAYGVGVALTPLVLLVPPPARVASHAPRLCGLLLRATGMLLVLSVAIMLLIPGWPVTVLGAVALVTVVLTFWVAAEPRRRHDDEDSSSDDSGGGGSKRPRDPWLGPGPDGITIDWSDFDRQREAWQTVGALRS